MSTMQTQLDRAWAIHQQGDYVTAERIYREVLQKDRGSANAWCFLGIALHDQRKYAEAEAAYREAIRLQPKFPIAWNNLGNTLRYLRRVDDAERAFETALAQRPGYVNAWKNRGTLRMWEGQIDAALEAYAEAMRLNPQDAELHRNLGVIHLLLGNFEIGWREYRWRWQTPGFVRPVRHRPVWQGESVAGKQILLYPEQGLGDTMHFVRMAQVLRSHGALVTVQSPPALLALLQHSKICDRLIPQGIELPDCHVHASFIDAADYGGAGLHGFPAQVPYLKVPENLIGYWGKWVERLPGKVRIGICWQGNPEHQADHVRSIPLAAFESLAALPDVTLVVLQQGFGTEQIERVSFGRQLIRLPADADKTGGAFLDTAAIMQRLDLVITSDTSTAHLAGALGCPTWLALATIPDWRWLLQGDRSPWYPTMKLFRQSKAGDWKELMDRIARSITEVRNDT